MASLCVRKLDNHLYEKLRLRASKHGVSMEEEVRQIIAQVVSTPDKLSEVFSKYFGAKNGIDLTVSEPSIPHNPMSFEE